ncbi:hypothetical protein [Nitrobacter sp. Nb-311A]|uniref:hypothetical protein n=1 Tax=Nitrobacter sp. Nb-311A TaxID=314253 RepID=UPI001FD887FB|nr:hypothetical protein [Nitrobacter sp. Nb-311A]
MKDAARAATAAAPASDLRALDPRSTLSTHQRSAAPPLAPKLNDEGSFHVGDKLRDAGSAASHAISGSADKIKDRWHEGANYVRENVGRPGEEALKTVQSSLGGLLERQPLMLGILGLAAGAAVAGAFRTSDLENDWAGAVSDEVKAHLNTRAGAVSQGLHEAADKLQTELRETGADVVELVKQTATGAANAAREAMKLP